MQMDETRWESARVEGSITVDELLLDYAGDSDSTAKDAHAIGHILNERPDVVAVLLQDEAGMVYEITR